jgi:hypothetical protein
MIITCLHVDGEPADMRIYGFLLNMVVLNIMVEITSLGHLERIEFQLIAQFTEVEFPPSWKRLGECL